MRNYLAAILASCVFASAEAQHDEGGSPPASKTNDTFNLIKALVGDWQGSYEWIGKNRKGPMNARYYLTGNGTAVVEDLIMDNNPNMTTSIIWTAPICARPTIVPQATNPGLKRHRRTAITRW